MALDYIICFDCSIHQENDPLEVMRASKVRDILEYIESNWEQIHASNPNYTRENFPVSGTLIGVQKEWTLGELGELWKTFSTQGETCCAECPVNFRGRTLGCFGAVNYPLTAEFEQWLINHYNPSKKLPHALFTIIDENSITGEQSDANRGLSENGMGVWASLDPVRKRLPDFDREISSSQIMSVINGLGDLYFDVLWDLLHSFGAVKSDDETMLEISKILAPPFLGIQAAEDGAVVFDSSSGPHSEEEADRLVELLDKLDFVLESQDEDDRPTSGFKQFLAASFVALCCLSPIVADG